MAHFTDRERSRLRRGMLEGSRILKERFENQRALLPKETKSECVQSTFYDMDDWKLTVNFVERGSYEYYEVPFEVWKEFNDAGSRGTYFNLYIRNKGFEYSRIG